MEEIFPGATHNGQMHRSEHCKYRTLSVTKPEGLLHLPGSFCVSAADAVLKRAAKETAISAEIIP
jgi:hypothetical protein